jgi:TonB-linked SusC/RagA family outer membrane protein
MKKLLLLSIMVLSVLVSMAQNRSIRGRIIDDTGQPVPDVSITIKDTKTGTTSGPDGTFVLNVPSTARSLVVTSVGFQDQEVLLGDKTNFEIGLSKREKQLDQVVVIAYGTQVKRKVTGAVSTVNAADIENRPFTSVDQALQGRVPGLQSVSPNGQPGGSQTIRIRGVSSVTGNNDPLFVVDGVPINSGDFSRQTTTSNALAGINPNDIESVTVLKDAAATAIYGSRAAAGVILITTKQGKSGKTKLRLDVEQGFGNIAYQSDLAKPLNSADYIALTREGLVNAGATTAQITSILNTLGSNSTENTDWLDVVTRQSNFTNVNFSASGGDQKTTFYTSVGYNEQEAPVITSAFKRYSTNINLNHKATDRFSFGFSLNGSYVNQKTPTSSGFFRNPILSAFFLRPTISPYEADGSLSIDAAKFGQIFNPLAIADYDRESFNNIKAISTINARYNIAKGLDISTKFGLDYIGIEEEVYQNPFFGDARTTNGRVDVLTTRLSNWVWTNMLDYHHDFLKSRDLSMDAKFGYEAQKSKQYNVNAEGTGVPFTRLLSLPAPSTPLTASAQREDYSQVSLFSLLQFNYKSKYSLSGSFRRDGSSRFGTNDRYGNFYSVGTAWNIDQENFLQDVSQLSALKLRASYGVTGDNRGVTPYDWRATYAFGSDYNQQPGSAPNTVGNPSLTWETNKQLNFAIDFGLFKSRLGGSVEWYTRKSENLLFDVPLSLTSGFTTLKSNTGTMVNKGWEVAINGTPVRTKNFTWDINFNISLNRNKVTSLPNGNADINAGNQIRRVGENISSFYTRLWAGVDPANGDPLWYTDATRKTTTNNIPSFMDIIGTAMPKGFGGVSTTLRYKQLSLDAQFNYQYGNKVYDNWGFIMWSDGAFPTLNKIQKQLSRWQKPGDIADLPIYVYGNTNSSNEESSRWYYKGDFIRLRDLTLSCRLPKPRSEKARFDDITFFVKGTNLWTKTFDKGITFDPEQGFNGTNDLQVFIQRTLTLGATIGL